MALQVVLTQEPVTLGYDCVRSPTGLHVPMQRPGSLDIALCNRPSGSVRVLQFGMPGSDIGADLTKAADRMAHGRCLPG